MRLLPVVSIVAAFCLPFTASAKDVASMARLMNGAAYTPPPCIDGMSKTASININFNGQTDSIDKARAAFDTQKKDMEAEIEKLGADKVQLNNYNYNISVNGSFNNGMQTQTFNYSGNLSYQVTGEDVALKITTRLSELHRQFSMNVNASRCQTPMPGIIN